MSETVAIALITAGAALVASAITAIASVGAVLLQERRRQRAAKTDEFFAAAQVVLTKGLTMIDRCRLWSALLQGQTHPAHSVALLARLRRPVDPMEVFPALIDDQEQMHMAGARVVLHADQETVMLCNQVLRAAKTLANAVAPGRRHGLIGRAVTAVRGLPGPDFERVRAATDELGDARRLFANRLRQLEGRGHVDVYALPEAR